jgi:hypothetical protein
MQLVLTEVFSPLKAIDSTNFKRDATIGLFMGQSKSLDIIEILPIIYAKAVCRPY